MEEVKNLGLENITNEEFSHFLVAKKGRKEVGSSPIVDFGDSGDDTELYDYEYEMKYKILSSNGEDDGISIDGDITLKSETFAGTENIGEYVIKSAQCKPEPCSRVWRN